MELAGYVDAFEQSVRSLLSVLTTLEERDWSRPTELPGWSVQDVVAHLAATERELLGDPRPASLPSYGPHVRSAFGRHMEDGVQARRGLPPGRLVAELRQALEERLPVMRRMRAQDPPVRVPADERWDTELLLRNRAFDAWMHEQDVRRAVARPGNLDGPGAAVTRDLLRGALPVLVAKRAGARPGQSVTLRVSGPVRFEATVVVADNGRAARAEAPGGAATATLVADWETVVRLLGGRVSPAEAVVATSGDVELAGRLVAGLCLTP
ncbi:MAG: hypothetical protein QOI54_1570 [Actinomycetota bacterium]|nr:hypothetical protein [Actinomycetota bacterium]